MVVNAVKNDIWIPFMESYRDLDFAKLKSIHTSNITKVSPKMNQIQSGEEYLATLKAFFDQIKGLKYDMKIRFSIISSATSSNKVFQKGYYNIRLRPNKDADYRSAGYSTFIILAQKDSDGKWKISYDSDESDKITEETFISSGIIYELE